MFKYPHLSDLERFLCEVIDALGAAEDRGACLPSGAAATTLPHCDLCGGPAEAGRLLSSPSGIGVAVSPDGRAYFKPWRVECEQDGLFWVCLPCHDGLRCGRLNLLGHLLRVHGGPQAPDLNESGASDDAPAVKAGRRPNNECPYWRRVERQFTFFKTVRDVLGQLQDAVSSLGPDFDHTLYHTDPDSSRLHALDELLADVGALLSDGEAEEAEALLCSGVCPGAYWAALEAFQGLLQDGLELCDEDDFAGGQ
jgi:hypothetical protein